MANNNESKGLAAVIASSSVGTLIEWYDFYIFGSLAKEISTQFFPSDNPTAAFLSTLATFAAGFIVRPFGALFFGRLGDLIGRKIHIPTHSLDDGWCYVFNWFDTWLQNHRCTRTSIGIDTAFIARSCLRWVNMVVLPRMLQNTRPPKKEVFGHRGYKQQPQLVYLYH